jgi:hypothetical protein
VLLFPPFLSISCSSNLFLNVPDKIFVWVCIKKKQ